MRCLSVVDPRVAVFDAKRERLDEVNDFVTQYLEQLDCPFKAVTQILLAVEEIFVNVASYAYDGVDGEVEIRLSAENGKVTLVFIDGGREYNPLEKPDPDITLSADKRQIGGLGIYMVKKLVDNVSYSYADGKNILTLEKKFE